MISREEILEYSLFFERNKPVNESSIMTIGVVLGILAYVHKYLTPIASILIKGTTKQLAYMSLKRRYNKLLYTYNKLKDDDEVGDVIKNALINRAKKLKGDIDNFKSGLPADTKSEPEVNTDVEPVNTDTENPNTNDSPEPQTPAKRQGTPVGQVTAKVDAEALAAWQAMWKGKCGSLEGKELQGCKARAADRALNKVRSGLSYCSRTDNPEGCRQTLSNLIQHWTERKRKYVMKKIRG